MNIMCYYARNEEEKEFDNNLTTAYTKDPENASIAHATMIGYPGGIVNMLRHMEDRLDELDKKIQILTVPNGCEPFPVESYPDDQVFPAIEHHD